MQSFFRDVVVDDSVKINTTTLCLSSQVVDVGRTCLIGNEASKLKLRVAGTGRTSSTFRCFSNCIHGKRPGGQAPGDSLATLLLTVQAEDILSAGIGERAVVGDTQDALDLSNSFTLTKQLRDRAAHVRGQKSWHASIASFGFVSQVGCVGVTGNTRHVTDELGSRLLLRLLRRAGLDAARLRHCFSCGTHIAKMIMVEPLRNGKEKFNSSKPLP